MDYLTGGKSMAPLFKYSFKDEDIEKIRLRYGVFGPALLAVQDQRYF